MYYLKVISVREAEVVILKGSFLSYVYTLSIIHHAYSLTPVKACEESTRSIKPEVKAFINSSLLLSKTLRAA